MYFLVFYVGGLGWHRIASEKPARAHLMCMLSNWHNERMKEWHLRDATRERRLDEQTRTTQITWLFHAVVAGKGICTVPTVRTLCSLLKDGEYK